MEINNFIIEADTFICENETFLKKFPRYISAPIVASFAEAIVKNDLNISKEDLRLHAINFLEEEKLEEVFYCMDEFIEAMVEFSSGYIVNQTKEHSIIC